MCATRLPRRPSAAMHDEHGGMDVAVGLRERVEQQRRATGRRRVDELAARRERCSWPLGAEQRQALRARVATEPASATIRTCRHSQRRASASVLLPHVARERDEPHRDEPLFAVAARRSS